MDLTFLIIISIALALLFTYTDYKKFYKVSLITKSCATLSIAYFSYICFISDERFGKSYFILIIIGILFGLLGDFFLALKKVHKEKEVIFITGLVAFLIGHIFYIIAFSLINPINKLDFVFAFIYLTITLVVFKISKLDFGNLKYGVILYSSVIALMMGKATSVLLYGGNSSISNIVFIGALLFGLSDGVLSFSMFGKKNEGKLSVCCHLLYFPAQLIIALSVYLF